MLTDRAGRPLAEVLREAALAVADAGRRLAPRFLVRIGVVSPREKESHKGSLRYRWLWQHRGKYDGATLRAIRAQRGVGRPRKIIAEPPTFEMQVEAAIVEHGSQRKAAAALGISLGKLQRTLRRTT